MRSRPSAAQLMGGSAVLLAATLASSVLGLLYTFFAARHFSVPAYSELVALQSVGGLIGAPAGTVQAVVARFVAGAIEQGRYSDAGRVVRRLLRWTAAASVAGTTLWVAAVPSIASYLHLSTVAPLWWALPLTGSTLVLPALRGAVQGLCRFGTLAALTTLDVCCKVLLGLALIWAGYGTPGAVAAMSLGVLLGIGLTASALRGLLRTGPARGQTGDGDTSLVPLLRFSLPAAAVTGGILALIQADSVLARHYLTAHDAGEYAAASVVGRGFFWLSGAVATVLLPVGARQRVAAQGPELAWWAALATLGVCASGMAVLAVAPAQLMLRLFGADFAGAALLLLPYGIAASLLAVGNVLSSYALGRGLVVSAVPALLSAGSFVLFAYANHSTGLALVTDLQAAALILVAGQALVLARAQVAARTGELPAQFPAGTERAAIR